MKKKSSPSISSIPPVQTTGSDLKYPESAAGGDKLFGRLFYVSLAVMLALIWVFGYDSGFCSDEMDMNAYGKANISYYTSGGKDTSYKSLTLEDGTPVAPTLHYYGSGFEYFAAGLTRLLVQDGGYEYNIRHMLNQFLAVLAVLFTGLITRKVTRHYRAAFIAAWLLFLTPFFYGNSIFNTKDIPFLTGYIATIYFILCFLEELPRPSWKVTIGLMLALAFTLSVRIGGMLLIMYLALFLVIFWYADKSLRSTLMPAAKSWGLKLIVAIGGAMLITILAWPFVLEQPLVNLQKAINVARDFPQRIPVIFDGTFMDSVDVPQHYLLTYLTRTIPVLMLVLFLCAIVYFVMHYQRFAWRMLLLIFFSVAFPLLYATYSEMALYNSWRHLLFVYPGIVVLAAAVLHAWMVSLRRPIYQWALASICALALVHPVSWTLKHNHYAYMYYNELSGGFSDMYYQYESDYWQISVKEAVDWFVEQAPKDDSVTLGTNAYSFTHYYLRHRYPDAKVRVISCGYRRRFMTYWDYAIFNVLFLTPQTLEYGYPPPRLTLHTVDVEQRPICAVMKDTTRFDLQGALAFNKGNYALSDSLFEQYLDMIGYATQPVYMEGIMSLISFTKLATGKQDDALAFALKSLSYEEDYFANLTVGIVYFQKGNDSEARKYLLAARRLDPNETYAAQYLSRMR